MPELSLAEMKTSSVSPVRTCLPALLDDSLSAGPVVSAMVTMMDFQAARWLMSGEVAGQVRFAGQQPPGRERTTGHAHQQQATEHRRVLEELDGLAQLAQRRRA